MTKLNLGSQYGETNFIKEQYMKKTNFEVNGKEYFRVTRTIGKKADGTPIRKTFYGSGIKEANDKADEYMDSINKRNERRLQRYRY